jgi:hypothetical protein
MPDMMSLDNPEGVSSRPAALTSAVRRCPIRRRAASAAPCALVASVSKRRCVAAKAVGAGVVLWAAWPVVVAVGTIPALPFGELVNQTGEFLLQDLNAFCNDCIGRQVSGGLYVVVESIRYGIIVKRLAFLRRLLPFGIFTWGPRKQNERLPGMSSNAYASKLTIQPLDPARTRGPCDAVCYAGRTRIR